MSPARQKRPSSNVSGMYKALAKKVFSKSLQVKKGESVTIETWTNGLPFALEVVREARRIGSIPILTLEDEEAYIEGVRTMPKDVLGSMGKHEYGLLSGTSAYVFIPGPPIGAYFTKLANEEKVASTSYNSSWYEAAEKAKLRGVRLSFGYVGKDLAKALGKTVDQIVRHQIGAALEADFDSIGAKGKQISERLADGVRCTLSSSIGSQLEFELKGETEIEDAIVSDEDVAAGQNMTYVPPGFVSKQTDPSSVTGKVKVSPSLTRVGLVKDATLQFESGRLVGWESKTSKDKLKTLIEVVPEDKRKLSIITLGLNPFMRYGYGQDRFVAGSIGLAGFGFTAIVQRGTFSAGGKTIIENGKLVPLS